MYLCVSILMGLTIMPDGGTIHGDNSPYKIFLASQAIRVEAIILAVEW